MPDLLVCITFDYDNVSSTIARGGVTPTLLSRGEFGLVGAERILDLLCAENVPSTWFIPGHTIESYPASAAAVRDAGCEIGHHGWTHRVPSSLGRDGEEEELVRGIASIISLTGKAPLGYRSPAWDLSAHSVELLLKHGFQYDSSLMGQDTLPYQVRQGDVVSLHEPMTFGPDTALVELPIHWSLDDFPHFEYSRSEAGIMPGHMNASLVLENWLGDFAWMKRMRQWGVLTYTFHPHIIGRGHRMLMLERLIRELREQGAAFVTMAGALDAYRREFPGGNTLRGR